MWGKTARTDLNAAALFNVSTRSHSSGSPSAAGPPVYAPAFACKMSSPPATSRMRDSIPDTAAPSSMSISSPKKLSPSSLSSSRSFSASRSSTTTLQPALSNWRAVANPIPDAPPVIAATLPSKDCAMIHAPLWKLFSTVGFTRLTCGRVDNHGDEQNCSGNHEAVRRLQIKKNQTVIYRLNNEHTQQRRKRAAASPKQAGPTNNGSSDSVQLEVVSRTLRG